MVQKRWQIIVYETDDSTPDFTITDDYLVQPPRIGGQRIYPLDCRAESLSWEVEVGDFSDFITSQMTDGSYNMHLVGRLARAQIDTGSGMTTVWTGRVVGLRESEGPGKYTIRFTDARFKERNNVIYETTDTALFLYTEEQPTSPYPLADWHNTTGLGTPAMDVMVNDTDGDYVQLELVNPVDDEYNPDRWQVLRQDLEAGGGSTYDTECFVDGSSRPVIQISETNNLRTADPETVLDNDGEDMTIRYFWVFWPDPGQPSSPDAFADFRFQPAVLPVSEAFPHHVGGGSGAGVDPIEEIRDRYDDVGIPYDSDTFDTYNATTNPYGLISHPDIDVMWQLHTEPRNLEEWTSEIYRALGLIPVIDGNGNIRPRLRYAPSVIGLPAVTDDDLAEPATFDHVGEELVTVVTGSTTRVAETGYPDIEEIDVLLDISLTPSYEYTHTNEAVVRVEHHIFLPFLSLQWWTDRQDIIARADVIFDRWAYGPLWLDILGLETTNTLEAGDWFRATFSNYPSHISGDRDSTPFIAQVMEKRVDPEGPRFRCLVGGLDDQPYAS